MVNNINNVMYIVFDKIYEEKRIKFVFLLHDAT